MKLTNFNELSSYKKKNEYIDDKITKLFDLKDVNFLRKIESLITKQDHLETIRIEAMSTMRFYYPDEYHHHGDDQTITFQLAKKEAAIFFYDGVHECVICFSDSCVIIRDKSGIEKRFEKEAKISEFSVKDLKELFAVLAKQIDEIEKEVNPLVYYVNQIRQYMMDYNSKITGSNSIDLFESSASVFVQFTSQQSPTNIDWLQRIINTFKAHGWERRLCNIFSKDVTIMGCSKNGHILLTENHLLINNKYPDDIHTYSIDPPEIDDDWK